MRFALTGRRRSAAALLAGLIVFVQWTLATPATAAGENVVTGTITYKNPAGTQNPVRDAAVELIEEFSGYIQASARTGANGAFTLTAGSGLTGSYKVRVRAESPAGKVTKDGFQPYEATTAGFGLTPGQNRTADLALDHSQTGRAFAVFDAVTTIGGYYNSIRKPGWADLRVAYGLDSGGSQYRRDIDLVVIGDSEFICVGGVPCAEDAYDWDVIAHEVGHFVADQGGFMNSPGGPHSACDSLFTGARSKADALGLAWGEGFATFFGTVVLQQPDVPAYIPNTRDDVYQDYPGPPHNTGGQAVRSLETNDCLKNVPAEGQLGGEDLEKGVFGALYDFYDNTPSEDGVAWSFADMINRLDSENVVRFDQARDALFAGRSAADLDNAAKILETWKFAPMLTKPNDNVEAASPLVFAWDPSGMQYSPNQSFLITIADTAGNELARCACGANSSFTVGDNERNRIIAAGTVFVTITGTHNVAPVTSYTARKQRIVKGTASTVAPVETFSIVAQHSGECLDVVDAGTANGARVQQWQCNGSPQQQWQLVPVPGQTYFNLRNVNASNDTVKKCLDVYNVQQTDGTPLQLWDCNGAGQQAVRIPAPEAWGELTVLGKCLDLTGASYAMGARLQLWTCNGGANQRFMLTTDPPRRALTITVQHTGQCLDVVDASQAEGARVQQWTCNGSDQQKWDLLVAPGGTEYYLINRRSNKCLDVYNLLSADGTPLQQWTCNWAQQQRFQIPALGSWGEIRDYGKCLDITGVSTTPGARLQLWTCNGAANQRFQFNPEPAGGSAHTFLLSDSRTSNYGTRAAFQFGPSSAVPIAGDWDGDGKDTAGVYYPATGRFALTNHPETGKADYVFRYGTPWSQPFVGDWNGDGKDEIGVRNGYWFYQRSSDVSTTVEVSADPIPYGNSDDIPVAGDWNGDRIDTIGVYRPSEGKFYLWNLGIVWYGNPWSTPFVGDWDGDGRDNVGIRQDGNVFCFRMTPVTSGAEATEAVGYGDAGIPVVIGDWDGNGQSTQGVAP